MNASKQGGVLVVGSVTVDLTALCERRPAQGETVLGSTFTLVAGGKGGNQALAAARMGAETWMVARVGDDSFREVVLEALRAAGVRDEYVTSASGTATGIAHIRVDAGGDNDIVIVPLANATLSPAHVDAAMAGAAGRARILLTQLEIPIETVAHALRAAKAAGLRTVLDPAPAPSQPLPAEVYAATDVITPNESEATLLTGVSVHDAASAAAAGRVLLDRGCGAAIVTLGAAGAMLVDDNRTQLFPGLSVSAIDSTAAGDAFTGALGARLAAGDSTAEAIAWANAAGALAATVMGASSSIPDLAAVAAAARQAAPGPALSSQDRL